MPIPPLSCTLYSINKAIKLEDTDTDFLNFKGSILFKLEKYDDAQKCSDKSLSINPNNFGALVGKAAILLHTDIDGALVLLNKARLISEKESSLWYNFGVIYLKRGRFTEAEESFNRAIQYDQEEFSVLSLNQIGIIYRRKLEYDKAIETYDKAIKISPNNPEVYLNKGIALGYMERHLDALDYFNKSFKLDPLNPRVLLSKATALANLNRDDEALTELDKLLRINSNDLQSLDAKGRILIRKGMFEEAEKISQKMIELDPLNIQYIFNKLHVLDSQKKYSESLGLITDALIHFASDERLLSSLCHVYLRLGKFELALGRCNEILERSSSLAATAHYNKACALACLGNKSQAISSLKSAIQLDRNFIEPAKTDEDFGSIRFDPEFMKLILYS